MHTATSSLSYSNSRREWDLDSRRPQTRVLARNLPYTKRMDEFSPILHRAYVAQPSPDRTSEASSSRLSVYKENTDLRTSAAISEYENVESSFCRSKSETEFSALVSTKIELKPPDRGKNETAEITTELETFPTDGETSPFKYKESIRRSMMKSRIHKKISGCTSIKLADIVADNGV